MSLAGHDEVRTESEGEGNQRRVVIFPKWCSFGVGHGNNRSLISDYEFIQCVWDVEIMAEIYFR